MQTFLPYSDFEISLWCLDYRRLGKQRVEARQIYDILCGEAKSNAWKNHPAVKMWDGCANALAIYHNMAIKIWIDRGYKNNMPLINVDYNNVIYPAWLGNKDFHASHRSNLLRKDYCYYSQFGWQEPNNISYVWKIKVH